MLTPATPDDLTPIAAMVNLAYRGRDGVALGWTSEAGMVAGARTTPQRLAAELADRPDARLLAWREAEGGEPLGCVWLEPEGEDAVALGMLTVHPDLQDRGLGRLILAAAEAEAARLGFARVRMTVVHVRAPLIAWYARRGYADTGQTAPFPPGEEREGLPRRAALHFIVMEKLLSPREGGEVG